MARSQNEKYGYLQIRIGHFRRMSETFALIDLDLDKLSKGDRDRQG